jgi:hypothetical protein
MCEQGEGDDEAGAWMPSSHRGERPRAQCSGGHARVDRIELTLPSPLPSLPPPFPPLSSTWDASCRSAASSWSTLLRWKLSGEQLDHACRRVWGGWGGCPVCVYVSDASFSLHPLSCALPLSISQTHAHHLSTRSSHKPETSNTATSRRSSATSPRTLPQSRTPPTPAARSTRSTSFPMDSRSLWDRSASGARSEEGGGEEGLQRNELGA